MTDAEWQIWNRRAQRVVAAWRAGTLGVDARGGFVLDAAPGSADRDRGPFWWPARHTADERSLSRRASMRGDAADDDDAGVIGVATCCDPCPRPTPPPPAATPAARCRPPGTRGPTSAV